jgi:hypothetical protein
MPRYFYCLVALLSLAATSMAQNGHRLYAPYGGVFTPRGYLRVLVVFAGFIDRPASNPNFVNAEQPLREWQLHPHAGGVPDYVDPVTGLMPALIYSDSADFRRYTAADYPNIS